MIDESTEILIESRDFWFKIVEFLQQNWALIDRSETGAVVLFLDDNGGVFDRIEFFSSSEAELALDRNGFRRYAEDVRVQSFLGLPQPPFRPGAHPNGPIYSSGRFWK